MADEAIGRTAARQQDAAWFLERQRLCALVRSQGKAMGGAVSSPREMARHVRAVLLILAAAAAASINVFPNAFHLDDFYRVVDNPGIQRVAPVWRHFVDPSTMATLSRITQFRPLLPLTLSLNYWWGGYATAGYHAVNLAFHEASSVLVYFLLLELASFGRATKDAEPAALIAAALFAVHPVSGIVVNYVSARDAAMMLTCLLAALLVYVRMRRHGDAAAGWIGAIALGFIAMLSKPNALVLPALVFAFEVWIAGADVREFRPWLRAAAFLVIPIAYFAWTNAVLHTSEVASVLDESGSGPAAYALAQTKVHLVYLWNFVWPWNLRQMPWVDVPPHWYSVAPIVDVTIIVASLVTAWIVRRRAPVVAFCIVSYWIFMAVESSVLPFYHLRADYRPYPSSAFLFGAAAFLAVRYLPRDVWRAAGVGAVVLLIAASTAINRTWRTEESLWTHSVELGGDAVAHLNLAMSIEDRRDPRVRANLERALAMSPGYVLAHVDYGLLLITLGERDTGLWQCREAVRLEPEWPDPHYWLSIAYEESSMPAAAADEAASAVRLDPLNLRYNYQAARTAQSAGRYDRSLGYLQTVMSRDERYELAAFLEGFAYQKLGERDRAIDVYTRFLSWQPNYAQAHFNLGYALMEKGDCAAAVREFEATLRLRPDYGEARQYVGSCGARTAGGIRP